MIKKTKINSTKDEGSIIIPFGDRILIKEDKSNKENKTTSGIIIPVTVNEDKGSKRGKVIAIGSGRYEDGVIIPISVKVNDNVLFQWGDKVLLEDEEYYLVKESELLAIIK